MTERYYNAPLGASIAQDVTEGSSDTSAFTSFRVTYDATGSTKEMALLALGAIQQAILQDTWPPA